MNSELNVIDRGKFKVVECVQGTEEWWIARAGIPTASEFSRILSPSGAEPKWTCATASGETCGVKHTRLDIAEKCAAGKNKKRDSDPFLVGECPIEIAAGADTYINELIADRVSLNPNYFTDKGRPVTKDMTNGVDLEPEARRFYEMERGEAVERVGFCLSLCERYGASPDGLVQDGGLELKCPSLPVQIGYLRAGTLPGEHQAQVHGAMIVTGAEWWDFMSYNPSVDPLLIRVHRDQFTEKLQKALIDFCDRFAEDARKMTRLEVAK